jgi:peptide/nickel transport system permease protein
VARYCRARLLDLVITVVGVSTLVFFLLRLSGDPLALFVTETTTREEMARLRDSLGFSAPLWQQYLRFVLHALQGDFGDSLRYTKPAVALVWETLPATLELTATSLGIAALLALPLGTLAAVRRGTAVETSCSLVTLVGQSMPFFWLGILLILVFSVDLRLLPSFGRGSPAHLILPAVTLSAATMAKTARLVRAGMLEVLGQEYIRTARAKGLAEWSVILRHAARNIAIPVVTILGLDFGLLLGGAVVTETIFAWPGTGRLMVQAIQGRDFPVVQAGVFILAIVFVVLNAFLDLVYVWLDPRVRHR